MTLKEIWEQHKKPVRVKADSALYLPFTILGFDGKNFHVRYDNGEENPNIGNLSYLNDYMVIGDLVL